MRFFFEMDESQTIHNFTVFWDDHRKAVIQETVDPSDLPAMLDWAVAVNIIHNGPPWKIYNLKEPTQGRGDRATRTRGAMLHGV